MKRFYLTILIPMLLLALITCKAETESNTPVLTLRGSIVMTMPLGSDYVEPGFFAFDEYDGDVTARVIVENFELDTSKEGVYNIFYSVINRYGVETVRIMRTIKVVRTDGLLILNQPEYQVMELGSVTDYEDPGFVALDTDGKDLTLDVKVDSNLNLTEPGTYSIVYKMTDSLGVEHSQVRKVKITLPSKPVIVLKGAGLSVDKPLRIEIGKTAEETALFDPGFKAYDAIDGDITAKVLVEYPDTNGAILNERINFDYTVANSKGVEAEVKTRYTKVVLDATPPEIDILTGLMTVVEVGTKFPVDLAKDIIAFDSGVRVPESQTYLVINEISEFSDDATIIKEDVEADKATLDAGYYEIVYYAVDDAGNIGSNKRWVNVADTTAPVLTYAGEELTENKTYVYDLDYAGILENVTTPTVSDNAQSYQLIEEGDGFLAVNSRRVGRYRTLAYGIDASGNESYKLEVVVNVLPPPNAPIINASFDDFVPDVGELDSDGNLRGWQWVNTRGYLVQGTWNAWGTIRTTHEKIDYSDYADGQYGGVDVASASDKKARTGIAAAHTLGLYMTTKQNNIPGTSIPIAFAAYITRTMGTLKQTGIQVYRDVDYVAQMYAQFRVFKSSQWVYLRIIAETPGMTLNGKKSIEVKGDPRTFPENFWKKLDIAFVANIDGMVTIEIEKTDIGSGAHADGTEAYYDDVSIYVKENGYALK